MTLLEELKNSGLRVTTDGRDLNISGPDIAMTDDLMDRIRKHKIELIATVACTVPERADLLQQCKEATIGMDADPLTLCDWLIAQGDPGWCVPAAIRRWAEFVQQYVAYPK
ncbi:MAG: hypothetical protein RQ826_15885 [Xanthomonadales bacterium]|nr:hypothetical protein [Xanthomonadales bacterium]